MSVRDKVDVCIVGGGVVGLFTAVHLSKNGLKVRLVDKLFDGSSRYNIGEVIRYGFHKTELPLYDYSLNVWQNVQEIYGVDLGFEPRGCATMALGEKAASTLRKEAEERDEVTFHDYDALQSLFGENIRLADDVVGAAVNEHSGVVETARALDQLRQLAVRQNVLVWGSDEVAQFLVYDGQICGVKTHAGDECVADHVIMTAGVWTGKILERGNIKLPIRPARCHVLQFVPSGRLPESIFVLRGAVGDIYVKYVPSLGRAVVSYTGVMDPYQATWSIHPDQDAMDVLQERLTHMLPALSHAKLAETRVVSLAVTPDHLPFIGRIPGQKSLIIATGFHGKSFSLAPGVAHVLHAMVSSQTPPVDIAPFALDRFRKG